MGKSLVGVILLTVSLGGTVVVSWMAVRGPSVFNGPGPLLDPTWYLVWIVQAALAAFVGALVGRASLAQKRSAANG